MQIFCQNHDFKAFLALLQQAKNKYPCKLYSYCLMNNHIHLILEPSQKDNISRFIQSLAGNYASYFNKIYSRTGTIWEGRFRCSEIRNERYFISCLHYIENNPLRAKIVPSAELYPWSSFKVRAYGNNNPIVDLDTWYISLGETAETRQMVYKRIFALDRSDDYKLIRKQTKKNGVLD